MSDPDLSDRDLDVLGLLTDYKTPDSWLNRQLGAQLAAQRGLIKATRVLVLLLEDKVDWVRYHAFSALVTLDNSSGPLLPLALKLTKDPFFRLRQAALDYVRSKSEEPSPTAPGKSVANG